MASDNSVNNTLRKDLGPVSAYAVAVAHGFDGTEAEWEQYIANASTKAAQASASATAAAQSEANAETAKEAAVAAKVEAQTAAQSASAAYGTSLLAPNYSTEATYTVGQHVIYSGNLYSCITAITTPEAWDATHWTQVQVGNEVSDLKSALTDVSAGFGKSFSFYPIQRTGKGWIPSNKEVGETINLSDIRSSTYETTGYWIVPCTFGDKLTVTTTGNTTTMRAFALLDENNTVLYISAKQTASLERHVFTVDNESAVKALIQSRTEETQYFGEYKNIESRFTAIEDNHASLAAKVGNDLTITSGDTVPYAFEVGKSYNVQNNSDKLISFRTRLSPSTDNVEQFNVSAGKTVVFTCTQIADGVSISLGSGGTTIAVSIQKIGSMTYNIEANTGRIVSLEESNVEIRSKLDNVENKIRITDNTKHAYTIKAGVSYRITNNSDQAISFRRWNGEELITPNTTVNSGITKTVTWESQTDKVSVYISEGSRDVIVEEIGTIDNRIATNTERINALEANIPDYFATMMETKLPIIRANMNEVGQYGDTFIFITDMHWDRNAKNSPSLIKYILDNTNINKILCGGDLISQGERNQMMQDMNDSIKSLEFPFHRYLLVAFGNHDSNKMVSNPSTEHFDLNTCYALLEKETESYITMMTDYDLSFYYDNKSNKTRYIVLDTGEDSGSSGRSFTAYQEFADVLLDTPQNWHIVVMAHIVTYGRFTYIGAMMSAFNAKSTYSRDGVGSFDFTNAKGYVDCAFGGHTHVDSTFTTSGGIPVIVTTTDSDRVSADDPYTYTKGTDQEQAFDVVTINYVAKTIKCVRIGRGVDRTINY